MVYDPSPSFGKIPFKKRGKKSAVVFTWARPWFPLCLLFRNFQNQELSALTKQKKMCGQIMANLLSTAGLVFV